MYQYVLFHYSFSVLKSDIEKFISNSADQEPFIIIIFYIILKVLFNMAWALSSYLHSEMTNWPVLSSLLDVRFVPGQREDASPQLNKAEARRGEGLRVWQAAQIQRATEWEQLSIPRHCGQEGGGLHTRPALQPNHGQQRSHARGQRWNNTHIHFYSVLSFLMSYFNQSVAKTSVVIPSLSSA